MKLTVEGWVCQSAYDHHLISASACLLPVLIFSSIFRQSEGRGQAIRRDGHRREIEDVSEEGLGSYRIEVFGALRNAPSFRHQKSHKGHRVVQSIRQDYARLLRVGHQGLEGDGYRRGAERWQVSSDAAKIQRHQLPAFFSHSKGRTQRDIQTAQNVSRGEQRSVSNQTIKGNNVVTKLIGKVASVTIQALF